MGVVGVMAFGVFLLVLMDVASYPEVKRRGLSYIGGSSE